MLIREITDISLLSGYRTAWRELLHETAGASFFQSLEWLQIYWKHYGKGKHLRVLIVEDDERPSGILPLVVGWERTRLGPLRVLTYPLDNWGSYYAPVGPRPKETLAAALEHLRRSPRDWDLLELRGSGTPGTAESLVSGAFQAAGMKAHTTRWSQTALVDLSRGWEAYCRSRKGPWLRRLRQAEAKLARFAKIEYVRYRPVGNNAGDGKPPRDYFGICEALARKTWQASAADGTTLCHDAVRSFLREVHEKAVDEKAIDVNLLFLDGRPAAFIYGYHFRGYVFGLRRGYDAELSRAGVGNVLLWHTLEDSAERGDVIYDMGSGSIETKRHFLSRLEPIYRHSHFPPKASRAQLLRLLRWWESRQLVRDATD